MHDRTLANILQQPAPTNAFNVYTCGCEHRLVALSNPGVARHRWFLCRYHEGYDDAINRVGT